MTTLCVGPTGKRQGKVAGMNLSLLLSAPPPLPPPHTHAPLPPPATAITLSLFSPWVTDPASAAAMLTAVLTMVASTLPLEARAGRPPDPC